VAAGVATDITEENRLHGSTSWQISGPAWNPRAPHGFADAESVARGGTVHLAIRSTERTRLSAFRLGWYSGRGARRLSTQVLARSPQAASVEPETRSAGWSSTVSLRIPAAWPGGVYLLRLSYAGGPASYVPIVVRDPAKRGGIAVVVPTNTYQAYNDWGGESLYTSPSPGGRRRAVVSFARPFRSDHGAGQLFLRGDVNLIRWLERTGQPVTYLTDSDLDAGRLDRLRPAVVIVTHGEYWTESERNAMERHSARGGGIFVMSANVGYWRALLARGSSGSRTLVVARGTVDPTYGPLSPFDPTGVTTHWEDPPNLRRPGALLGVDYAGAFDETPGKANDYLASYPGLPLRFVNASHPLLRGTGLADGAELPGFVGGEVDVRSGAAQGVELIAHSPVTLYGAAAHSDVTWWAPPGRGPVFAVGTFYWVFGLDAFGTRGHFTESPVIQRITLNALALLRGVGG
jgi:hypothetical protein